jgi:hypothetical protein
MYPTRTNTDAIPVNLALLITGIGVVVIVLVIAGALVVDRVDSFRAAARRLLSRAGKLLLLLWRRPRPTVPSLRAE